MQKISKERTQIINVFRSIYYIVTRNDFGLIDSRQTAAAGGCGCDNTVCCCTTLSVRVYWYTVMLYLMRSTGKKETERSKKNM